MLLKTNRMHTTILYRRNKSDYNQKRFLSRIMTHMLAWHLITMIKLFVPLKLTQFISLLAAREVRHEGSFEGCRKTFLSTHNILLDR